VSGWKILNKNSSKINKERRNGVLFSDFKFREELWREITGSFKSFRITIVPPEPSWLASGSIEDKEEQAKSSSLGFDVGSLLDRP